MAKLARILLKPFALLLAIAQNATATASVSSVPPTPAPLDGSGMSAFLKQLKQDPDLRTRFARDPRATFHELGLDPAAFQLPETLDAARIDDVLRAWMGPTGPTQASPAAAERSPLQTAQWPPSVVYGPPPMPTPIPRRSEAPPPPAPSTHPDDNPSGPVPPAPVYGPPPGLPRP